jgi:hypothetical protein
MELQALLSQIPWQAQLLLAALALLLGALLARFLVKELLRNVNQYVNIKLLGREVLDLEKKCPEGNLNLDLRPIEKDILEIPGENKSNLTQQEKEKIQVPGELDLPRITNLTSSSPQAKQNLSLKSLLHYLEGKKEVSTDVNSKRN